MRLPLSAFTRACLESHAGINREVALCHSVLSTFGEPFECPGRTEVSTSQWLRFNKDASKLLLPTSNHTSGRGPYLGSISGNRNLSELHQYNHTRELHIFRFLTGQPDRPSPRKPGPDAGDCDEAHDNLTALRQRLDAIQKPSTLRSWSEVVVDVSKSVLVFVTATGRVCMAIPGWIRDFYSMPKEDWAAWKAGAWKTVKHEAHHYWVGTKLLGMDIKIASRLAIKAARGVELSRRERKQLTRTTADMFRLVPMIIILVIPFLEFALPFLLRIFPNMLPSTYEDKLKKEEELKRRLSIKLELARFLQDTVAEVAKDVAKRKGSGSAAELFEFIKKVRSGEQVENSDILRFAQLFKDDLTLDNLERVQLVSMCQFVGLAPFGTDAFLRTRLRTHLQQIKKDDYQIEKEGLENLTLDELRSACRARGIRAPFGEGALPFMRRQLQDWLDLSLHRGLPSSLLLLSRAFTITATVSDVAVKKDLAYEKVKETLSVIPEEVVDKVGLENLGAEEGSVQALQKKLDLLKREESLIKEELARAAVAQSKKIPGISVTVSAQSSTSTATITAAAAAPTSLEEPMSVEEVVVEAAEEKQRRLRKAVQALIDLVTSSGVAKERVTFMNLVKVETDRINEDLAKKTESTGNLTFSNRGMEVKTTAGSNTTAAEGSDSAFSEESLSIPKRLNDRVSRMLKDIEKELDNVELSIGNRMHVLDTDHDGIITQQELEHAFRLIKEQLSPEEHQELYQQLNALSVGSGIQVNKLLEMETHEARVGVADQLEQAAHAIKDGDNKPDVVKIHTL